MPEVSIIIPVYNGGTYIQASLDSVLAQTFQDYEIIIVDDGSTDNTRLLVQDYCDQYPDKMKYFYQENQGVNKARLKALSESAGDYIALLDADDIWVKDKILKQLYFFKMRPETDMVFTDFKNFSGEKFATKSYFNEKNFFRKIPTSSISSSRPECKVFKGNFSPYYFQGNFILQSALMLKRESCVKFDILNSRTSPREMYEFCTRKLHLLNVGFVDEVLTFRRFHGKNVTLKIAPFHVNTVRICRKALKYPWINKRAKKVLRKTLEDALYVLGRYYFLKGDYYHSRFFLKKLIKRNIFRLKAYLVFSLTFIMPMSIPPKLTQKNVG